MKNWHEIESGEDRIAVYDSLAEAREQFGENYAGFVISLTRSQVEALLQKKIVAFDISGREYAGFLVLEKGDGASQ